MLEHEVRQRLVGEKNPREISHGRFLTSILLLIFMLSITVFGCEQSKQLPIVELAILVLAERKGRCVRIFYPISGGAILYITAQK